MADDSYHHANLKQELIDAGFRLILKEGVGALSLRRLAAECGVSHAAPYKHFKSKEDILSAILSQGEQAFISGLSESMSALQPLSPKERLVRLGVGYVQFMVEHPDYFRLLSSREALTFCPNVDLAKEPPRPDSSLTLFYGVATAYLESIHANPENRPTDILAMWAMVHGLATMLLNRTVLPGAQGNYKDMVAQILSNNLVFP